MKIGIDLQVLGAGDNARSARRGGQTGVANYIRELTRALLRLQTNHEFVLFGAAGGFFKLSMSRVKVVNLPPRRLPFVTSHIMYSRIMNKENLDMLHGPANVLPFFYRGRGVITIHDLLIYKHPEWFPRGQWFAIKYLVPSSIKRASKIIVPSQAVADDLTNLFKVHKEKIRVIAHGVSARFFAKPQDEDTERRHILFVGSFEPRKNLQTLLEAYAMLPADIQEKHNLMIAGMSPKIRIKNEERGRSGKIKTLGYVRDEDLPGLYQKAKVFVYPSLAEGFGLPVLEAMAAGTPVVVSREVAANFEGAPAVGVDAKSPAEIAEAIERLIRDDAYSRQISEAAQESAKKFAWEKTARATLDAYLA